MLPYFTYPPAGAISLALTMMNSFSSKLILFLLMAGASNVNASQCRGHDDIWEYVEEAEYIFSAMVISITSDQLERRPITEEKIFTSPVRLEIGFDPVKVIRGDIDELEYLVTWDSVDMSFTVGEHYYFIVNRHGELSQCSATYELLQMEPVERAEFLEELGFISAESAESSRRFDAYHKWKWNLWSTLNSTNQPWMWALNLNSLNMLSVGQEIDKAKVKELVDKLLAHPSPGAEALYWAVLTCSGWPRMDSVCRMSELAERLDEADGDNLYVSWLNFIGEFEAKIEIKGTSSEHWDYSYFDVWLDQALKTERAESYWFQHFSELTELLIEYGESNGFYTDLKDAPLDWRVVNHVMSQLVYPWQIPDWFSTYCGYSATWGRTDAALACRKLGIRLLENSKTFDERSGALYLIGRTYSKEEPEFLRLLREGAAWSDLVKKCMDRIHEYRDRDRVWSIASDAGTFVNDFDKYGEIVAFQNLAEAEGWKYKDASGAEFECTELPNLPDMQLVKVLGPRDPG